MRVITEMGKLAVSLALLPATPAVAFDGDFAINQPNFTRVNFVDIKSYEFGPWLDDQWRGVDNGWRITAGSMDYSHLYENTELRLSKPISEVFIIGMELEQERFYDLKPNNSPMVQLQWRPYQDYGISLIGTPVYDKRYGDLGLAFHLGSERLRKARISMLATDVYYNSKNSVDDSYYDEKPHQYRVEAIYEVSPWLTVELDALSDRALQWRHPADGLTFSYQAHDYNLNLIYTLSAEQSVRLRLRDYALDKSRVSASEVAAQDIDYHSLDLFWLKVLQSGRRLSLGIRYDDYEDALRDVLASARDRDYSLTTTDYYAIIRDHWNTNLDAEYALYMGDSVLRSDYLQPGAINLNDSGWDYKFRFTLDYSSDDQRSTWRGHVNLNLDNLADHPWDGGGMSYQVLF